MDAGGQLGCLGMCGIGRKHNTFIEREMEL